MCACLSLSSIYRTNKSSYVFVNIKCVSNFVFKVRIYIVHACIYLFCSDSTGINWKLWTILQSRLWLKLIKGYLARRMMSPGRTKHVCNLWWTSILSKLKKSLKYAYMQRQEIKLHVLKQLNVYVYKFITHIQRQQINAHIYMH